MILTILFILTGHFGSVKAEYEDLYICSSSRHPDRVIYRVGSKPEEDAYTLGTRLILFFRSALC